MAGVRDGPQDVMDALDVLDQAVFKLAMLSGLLAQDSRDLSLGESATNGLYFFLDGLGDEIEQASEVINQAYRNGGKR